MTLSFLATRRGKITLVLLLPGVAIFSAIATSYTNQLLAGHHAPNSADRRLPLGAARGDHLPARRRADRPAHQQRPQPNPELHPNPSLNRSSSHLRPCRPPCDERILLIGTPFAWARNLRTGQPVDIRLKGKRRPTDVEVFTDGAGVVEHYAVMARDNHAFAKFNQIGLDQAGNPSPADLHLAWAAGARVIRLAPR